MTTERSTSRLFRLDPETPIWRDERFLRVAGQLVSAAIVIGLIAWMIANVIRAAELRGLSLGFGFLSQSAGFPIGETVIPYSPSDSFLYAFWVGVVGTLRIAVIGIALATVLGTFVGITRLSSNWLVSKLALAFIEIHRNIPLLVLLFLWYRGVFTKLPNVQNSIVWPGPVYVSQRGLYMTWPQLTESGGVFVAAILIGLFLAAGTFWGLRRVQDNTGRSTYYLPAALIVLLAAPAIGWLLAGPPPLELNHPELVGFNFQGGVHITPEFAALMIGLITYTAAFIAEVVRAGIQAISRGQIEASRALGLTYSQTLSLVIMPQALRIIIPPLISQYLNLVKNSSLAFLIGYPELFFIGKTTTNQAGRAIQVMLLVMGVYLSISLVTSWLLNAYNRRIQFDTR